MRKITTFGIIFVLIAMVFAAMPMNVTAENEFEVIITQEGPYECTKVTFEGGGHVEPLLDIPEAGMDFTGQYEEGVNYWLTATSGQYWNNPSPPTIAAIWGGNYADVVFDEPVSRVDFFYGSLYGINLEAYNSNNDLIGSTTGQGNFDWKYRVFLKWDPISIDVGENNIKYIRLHGRWGGTLIDDLKTYRILPTPENLIEIMVNDIEDMGLENGIETSLVMKLGNAIKSLEKDNYGAAINQLEAFINEVYAQNGNKIPTTTANEWVQDAQTIKESILGS